MSEYTQIPEDQLIEGRWYVGRGRNANVALWGRRAGRLTFLTVGFTYQRPTIKDEGYYMDERPLGKSADKVLMSYGCFQPFLLIEEGDITVPVDHGVNKHYAKVLKVPRPPRDVHHEPVEFSDWPMENCSECHTPTRYWLNPKTPLCQVCAAPYPNPTNGNAQS